MLTRPFFGVTNGSTILLGQMCLPVTFGTRHKYYTKLININMAHIGLPYHTILGYPELTKFMAATHHGYNVLKMHDCSGVINIIPRACLQGRRGRANG